MKSRLLLFICAFYLLGHCSINRVFHQQYDPQYPSHSTKIDLLDQDAIKSREGFTNWLNSGPSTEFFPTAAVAIVINSQPVYTHYVNSGPTKTYGMASITKIFTGLSIMMLVDEGKIDLNDPVQKYLPKLEIKRPGLKSDHVRIRHLISHTSGLPDLRFYKKNEWIPKSRSGLPFRVPIPIYPAGSHYRYSNQGFMILGKVIESVSAMPLKSFYQNRIFDPLAMNGARVRKRHSGAFGIRLTLPDIIKFSSFWLRSGKNHKGKQLLTKASFHKMMQPPYYYPAGPNNEYCGLAWRVQRDKKGIQQFFHIGGADGVMVWLQVFPRMNTAVMYLANPPEMKSEVMHRIPYLQYRLGKLASQMVDAKTLPSDYEVTLAKPGRDELLIGKYISPVSSKIIQVQIEDPNPSDPEIQKLHPYNAKVSLGNRFSEKLKPISTRHYLGNITGTKYDFVYEPGREKPVAIATVVDYFKRIE